MYKLVICVGKETYIKKETLEEVHKDCAIIERLAHKQHCFITVKCYEGDNRLFDRFFG